MEIRIFFNVYLKKLFWFMLVVYSFVFIPFIFSEDSWFLAHNYFAALCNESTRRRPDTGVAYFSFVPY